MRALESTFYFIAGQSLHMGESREIQPLFWKNFFCALPWYGNDGRSSENTFGKKKL